MNADYIQGTNYLIIILLNLCGYLIRSQSPKMPFIENLSSSS